MPPLPNSLRIGYRDYMVEIWPSKTANAHGAHGLHDPISAIIYVSEDRTGWDAVDTLFHEILHAIYTVAGVAGTDDEEHTVSHIAPSWVQVWRDNPELRDFFNSVESRFTQMQILTPFVAPDWQLSSS